LHSADFRRPQGNGRIDHDLAGEQGLDLAQGFGVGGIGHSEDADLGLGRAGAIVAAADARAGRAGGESLSKGLGFFRISRADPDVMTGLG